MKNSLWSKKTTTKKSDPQDWGAESPSCPDYQGTETASAAVAGHAGITSHIDATTDIEEAKYELLFTLKIISVTQ